MSRGTIYYITKNKESECRLHFDETQYYDKLESLHLDHVNNQDEEESKVSLRCLADTLFSYGAIFDAVHDNGDFAFSFHFKDAKRAQQNYFSPKFTQLKQQVYRLTLTDIIHSAPMLDCITNDEYGDLIAGIEDYDKDITFDDFFRRLESGVTYYVHKKVILMH